MLNRKRQIIDAMMEDLHEQFFNYVEEALAYSDMRESKEIIAYIMAK